MQPATLPVTLLSFVLVALCLPYVQTDAYAAPPWGTGDKPSKGKRNKPPTITGTPSTSAEVEQYYSFQPAATDRDGDALTFSISNRPGWAAFDTAGGFLSGYPAADDAGSVTQDIVISVSDARHTVALAPFSITVGDDGQNAPPVIGGSPPGEVLATEPYSFTPSASDPDQDVLRFSGINLPDWASFDASSGQLYGTPDEGHVGTYENIRITVTDGMASDSTDPFAITVVQTAAGSVTLSWVAPTHNTDGSLLTDLAGYRIYYGTTPGSYDRRLEIVGAGVLTAVIEDLTPGTWHFAATAFTRSGSESDLSGEARYSLP